MEKLFCCCNKTPVKPLKGTPPELFHWVNPAAKGVIACWRYLQKNCLSAMPHGDGICLPASYCWQAKRKPIRVNP
ncbi:MAG: hypothetical protein K9K79_00720, partial [Desulfohalobiaceae bacterium]|nr:hypothetical protein [Desulfohalobiaceae bacterium]